MTRFLPERENIMLSPLAAAVQGLLLSLPYPLSKPGQGTHSRPRSLLST